MLKLLAIIGLGFVLGTRHATDPDHVIAVSTIVSRYRSFKEAALIGTFWGIGHTLTIVTVGGAIVTLGWAIPARLGLLMEFSVGLMLVLLGVVNLAGTVPCSTKLAALSLAGPLPQDAANALAEQEAHTHLHASQTPQSAHAHEHGSLSWLDRLLGRLGLYQMVRPLIDGVVHGMAGSAAVALVVLATIRDPRWAIGYLLVFGLGTIFGMMLITAAIAAPFAWSHSFPHKINGGFRVASGVISFAFGMFLVYHITFVNGLFSNHPQWTPH